MTEKQDRQFKRLGELLDLTNLVFAKCECCNVRYKERDKKWCRWCIDRHKRRKSNTPETILTAIRDRVEPAYLTADISDFDGEVLKMLLKWTGSENMFFCGDCGRGKTHAMYALLKTAIANGFDGLLLDFGQLCRQLRASFGSNLSEKKARDVFVKADVLLIDDIGLKSTATDYEYDVFYDILDRRHGYYLSTVLSSNKTPEQLAACFDKRIASRLSVFTEIMFAGEDRRQKNG